MYLGNGNIKYDYRNLITQIQHKAIVNSDTSFYLTFYSYDEAGNRFEKTIYKYTSSSGPPEDTNPGGPITDDYWDLYSVEIYSRDISGKELAIYKNGNVLEYPVYGLDMIGKIKDDEPFYYFKDHLGSVRATVNSSGEVVSAQDYDSWGYLLQDRTYDSDDSKFKFTGKERDVESDYDYFGARYYDCRIANWTSTDPLMEKHNDFSPYNYVLRNPLIFYDPDGKQVFLGGDSYQESKGLGQYIDVNETQQTSMSRFDNKRSRQSGITTTDVGLLDPVDWLSGGLVTMGMRLTANMSLSATEKLVQQSLNNISETTGKKVLESGKEVDIDKVAQEMIEYLGEGFTKFENPAKDVIFMSQDKLRKIRFDINSFYPHDFKHIDIETKVGIINKKAHDWINVGKIKITD